ncbi:hypothetical protein EAI30_03355 [Romboutsia ilealis]|uniref:Uncharacterized protein n=1 Tax=Romboutsia faecis TaxID=2764597 RepID=A0ABR7JR35_9FIRM|nr:hypothetical protein [Romboutsia faecis]MBC5997366.1 hypothetical protein [Romboutsia faecis]MRN23648.1 hypothetical protein [Romboutsia ilealis]
MRKDKQSKRILDESPLLTDLVNHGQTYTEIRDMIEDENEEVRKKVNKKVDIKTPSYQDMHPYNNKF